MSFNDMKELEYVLSEDVVLKWSSKLFIRNDSFPKRL